MTAPPITELWEAPMRRESVLDVPVPRTRRLSMKTLCGSLADRS